MTTPAGPDGPSTAPADARLAQVAWQALRRVVDPEAGLNVVDLGLVYGVEAGPSGVAVRMTMTSAACPMAGMIVDDAFDELEAALPPGTPVDVDLVWEPPWTPERLSADARLQFGWVDTRG